MRSGGVFFVWAACTFLALTGCSSPFPARGKHSTLPRGLRQGPLARRRGRRILPSPPWIAVRWPPFAAGLAAAPELSSPSHSKRQRSSTTTWLRASSCRLSLSRRIRRPLRSSRPPRASSVLPGAFTAGNTTNQVQFNSSAAAVQSTINDGLTRILSSIGAGGISNTISNSANDQMVRQVITANIDINGLSKLLQPGVAATLMSRLQAANSQFR